MIYITELKNTSYPVRYWKGEYEEIVKSRHFNTCSEMLVYPKKIHIQHICSLISDLLI